MRSGACAHLPLESAEKQSVAQIITQNKQTVHPQLSVCGLRSNSIASPALQVSGEPDELF